MVNVPGRSKGCSTCRQRRLKCDESMPECLQCVKKGVRCPGPRTGAIFIHALPSQQQAVCSMSVIPRNASCQKAMTIPYQTIDDRLVHSLLLSNYQPSRAEMFDQLFVSHFIESFAFKEPSSGKKFPTWLDKLAELIVSPTHDVVKHSIRASSAFFYGFLAQDIAIQTEASRWYLKALQGLQYHLSRQLPSSFNGDMICTAVMLTHFESLAGTAPGAWFQHVRGASMMIARGGPESCCQGFLHNIFRHLRLLTAISSFFRNEQHPFSTAPWMTVPFEKLPKGPFDELVDVYFSLLPCLAIADKMITSTGEDFHSFQTQLSTMVHQIITHLHMWWSQCVSRTDLNQANPEPNIAASKEKHIHRPSDPYDVPLLPHRDMPSTALSALFDAANVIVFRLLSLVSPSAHLYEYRVQQHVQSIFSALDFVTNMPPAVSQRGYIMVALPLRIIRIWAPCNGKDPGDDTASPLADKWAHDLTSSAEPAEFFAHVAAYIHDHRK